MQRVLVLLSLALCAASLQAATYKLNLFIWSEYIDPDIITEFEKRFDTKVIIDLYEDEAAMMAKLQGGGVSQYDVIVPPDHTVPALIKLKLLAPLRHDNIPNISNIDERFVSPWYDPSNRFTVPYQWGTLGIYARKPAEKPYNESWALLFDASETRGDFMLIDGMRDTIGAALKFHGHSLNTVKHAELNEALNTLVAAKKRSKGFAGGVGGKNKVLAKEVTMAMAYSGDAARGMKEDDETYYFIPREGSQIWMDNLAICAKAPNRIVAEKFLNHLLKPEIGAQLVDYNQYATPNKAALAHVRPENLNNPMIYPPHDVMQRLEFLHDLGKQTRLYDEIWTQVKSK
ncbi:MAG TPA: spermidine/putrescine ABC transporter substrate-binding protein [Verrucomicrobiae bacterium]|jgi:spermidine/putrescine transport system substrate-binding protein